MLFCSLFGSSSLLPFKCLYHCYFKFREIVSRCQGSAVLRTFILSSFRKCSRTFHCSFYHILVGNVGEGNETQFWHRLLFIERLKILFGFNQGFWRILSVVHSIGLWWYCAAQYFSFRVLHGHSFIQCLENTTFGYPLWGKCGFWLLLKEVDMQRNEKWIAVCFCYVGNYQQ